MQKDRPRNAERQVSLVNISGSLFMKKRVFAFMITFFSIKKTNFFAKMFAG